MPAMKCLDCNARWYRMGPAYGGDCPDCGSDDIDLDTDPVEDDEPEEDEPLPEIEDGDYHQYIWGDDPGRAS